jgi:hypothetical protein
VPAYFDLLNNLWFTKICWISSKFQFNCCALTESILFRRSNSFSAHIWLFFTFSETNCLNTSIFSWKRAPCCVRERNLISRHYCWLIVIQEKPWYSSQAKIAATSNSSGIHMLIFRSWNLTVSNLAKCHLFSWVYAILSSFGRNLWKHTKYLFFGWDGLRPCSSKHVTPKFISGSWTMSFGLWSML